MAFRFEAAGERLEVHQTRRGVRIAMWLLVGFGALGAAIAVRSREVPMSVACGGAGCAFTYGRAGGPVTPLDAMAAVEGGDGDAWLRLADGTRRRLCKAAVQPLARFLADPQQEGPHVACALRIPGIPIAGLIAGLAGMLLVLGALGLYLVETHVVVDRRAGTVAMRGSRWPFSRWDATRPLGEVRDVEVRSLYVGRGQRQPFVRVVFDDDTSLLAAAPAAFRPAQLDEQVAELRRALKGSR